MNISISQKIQYYTCYMCDCQTFPYCSIDGFVCNECFDVKNYIHYTKDKEPGVFKKNNNVNQVSSLEKNSIIYPYIQDIITIGNGDCLYECVSHAFCDKISIEDFRNLVAQNQTKDTYEMYKVLSKSNSEYKCIKKVKTFRQFKNVIQRCGWDINGYKNVMWGDENAINIISGEWNIIFVIFNEKGIQLQSIDNTENAVNPKYILLRLDSSKKGNEHYDLISFNKHTLLSKFEWVYLNELLTKKVKSIIN